MTTCSGVEHHAERRSRSADDSCPACDLSRRRFVLQQREGGGGRATRNHSPDMQTISVSLSYELTA